MNQLNSTEKKRLYHAIFALCWFTYFSTYIGRLNYSAAMPAIIESTNWSKGTVGLVGTIFFLSYGVGQLVNGILGDQIAPQKMIFIGLLISSISNLVMGFGYSIWVMYLAWGINGLAQSMIWSPMTRFFCLSIEDLAFRERAIINMSTAVALGTLGAYFFSALAIYCFQWHGVFYLAFFWLLASSFLWLVLSNKLTKKLYVETTLATIEQQKQSQPLSLNLTLIIGLTLIIIAVMTQGVLKDGVTNWVPIYFQESFHLSSVNSILFTTFLPIFSLVGVYLSAWINRKVNDEIRTSIVLFFLSLICLVVLVIANNKVIWLSTFCLAATTAMMLGINTMLISLYPTRFLANNKVSTISGVLNSSAYLATATSCYGIGYLADHYGWTITIITWIVVNILGLVCCVVFQKTND